MTFSSIVPLFDAPNLALVGAALRAGGSPGEAWTDDELAPRSALVWDRAHCFYLVGDANNPIFNQKIAGVIAATIWPEIRRQQLQVIKVSVSNPGWETVAADLFPGVNFRRAPRCFYALGHPKMLDWRERIPAGFRLERIEPGFITDGALENGAALREEIESCWTSAEAFFTNGFGFCTIQGSTLTGWCTIEYLSPGRCGIGIETIEAYQRRGLASLAASAVVEECLARGLLPHWDSWEKNTPSIAVAEKVGFELVESYSVLFAWLES